MRKIQVLKVFCGVAAICLLSGAGWSAETNRTIPEASAAPKIDGVLDDECWKHALEIGGLLKNGKEKTSDTTFRLCRDNTWLYVAVKCMNDDMRHVEQTVFEHDGAVQKDDSVEIYIDSGTNQKNTYHFMLSFANIGHDKRFDLKTSRLDWRCPWRSATRILPDGWEAEIAIPLFAIHSGNSAETKINFIRNKIISEVDEIGAKQGERSEYSALVAGNSKDSSIYPVFKGLGGFKAQIPFAPQINKIVPGAFQQKDGGYVYPVDLFMALDTKIDGNAEIFVIEEQNGLKTEHAVGIVKLEGATQKTVEIPVQDFHKRAITVVLRDQSGSLLAVKNMPDSDAPAIIKDTFVGRSYYTSEKNAEIKIVFGVSDQMLKEFCLLIESETGETLFKKENPLLETVAVIPLAKLKEGGNKVTLTLSQDKQKLFAVEHEISKLPPRPGCEVKADFIRKTLLKNGEPFFPIGMNVHHLTADETHYKTLSEIGFNTLAPSATSREFGQPEMELARKYNLQVIFEGFLRSDVYGGDLQQTLETYRGNYEKLLPNFQKRVAVLRDYDNLLMYFTGHEPNIIATPKSPLLNAKIMEWFWHDLQELDPYRPKLAVFTKIIPDGDEWTRWVDVLSDDIYIRPWTGTGRLAEPGIGNAYYANKVRMRCEKDHKIMFMVPLAGQHSIQKGPVGNSNPQMLCQNYVSLIYGAKGTIFFCLTTVSSYHTWEGLKTICAQTKQLAPALLNYEVKQDVAYPGQEYMPLSSVFPQVLGRLFKYPDGDYLLLAVNLVEYAAEAVFDLPGAESAQHEFDACQKLQVENGRFTEKLEPYGTRAYRIKGVIKEPVKLAILSKPDKATRAPSINIPAIVEQMQRGVNYCPNPCFERQLIEGTPDFYKPFFFGSTEFIYNPGMKGSAWFVDDEVRWEGHPSLFMNRMEGENRPRGTFSICYPPKIDKPTQMVYSFYAKAKEKGSKFSVNFSNFSPRQDKKTFTLSDKWERYIAPITVHSSKGETRGVILMPAFNTQAWISGLQLEYGEKPTDFRDDSVPDKSRNISQCEKYAE